MKSNAIILLNAKNSRILKRCPLAVPLTNFFRKLLSFHLKGSGLEPQGVAKLALLPVAFLNFRIGV